MIEFIESMIVLIATMTGWEAWMIESIRCAIDFVRRVIDFAPWVPPCDPCVAPLEGAASPNGASTTEFVPAVIDVVAAMH